MFENVRKYCDMVDAATEALSSDGTFWTPGDHIDDVDGEDNFRLYRLLSGDLSEGLLCVTDEWEHKTGVVSVRAGGELRKIPEPFRSDFLRQFYKVGSMSARIVDHSAKGRSPSWSEREAIEEVTAVLLRCIAFYELCTSGQTPKGEQIQSEPPTSESLKVHQCVEPSDEVDEGLAGLISRVAIFDPALRKAIGIAGQHLAADPRMKAIAAVWPSARSWTAPEWSEVLDFGPHVSPSGVRNTTAWEEFEHHRERGRRRIERRGSNDTSFNRNGQ